MSAFITSSILRNISNLGLPPPVLEYEFHKKRKWRFDFAWPDLMLALEIDGGTWIEGRHNQKVGFVNDLEKFNEANLLGWCVLRVTSDWVKSAKIYTLIRRGVDACL